MITLISSKKLGGCYNMRHPVCTCSVFSMLAKCARQTNIYHGFVTNIVESGQLNPIQQNPSELPLHTDPNGPSI